MNSPCDPSIPRSSHGWALEQSASEPRRQQLAQLAREGAPAPASGVHRWARGVLEQAWRVVHGSTPTQRELDAVQGVAAFDGGYGRGYLKKPELQGAHNWGAVQCCLPKNGECPGGSVKSTDYNAKTGKEYVVCFKAYPDDVAGAADTIRHLTTHRPKTWAAFKAGLPVQDWVRWMYVEHYFGGFKDPTTQGEQNVTDYAGAVWRQLQKIWAELGETPSFQRGEAAGGPLRPSVSPSSAPPSPAFSPGTSSGTGVAVVAALGLGLGALVLRGRR